MIRAFIYCCFFLLILACKKESNVVDETNKSSLDRIEVIDSSISEAIKDYKVLIKNNPEYISNGFDFPVGKPNAHGYYNAQKFQENNHLGDDWNGVGGGNTDLGDPIYSVANGYISVVKNYEGGWGNVIRIVHLHDDKLYESLYAHCDSTLVLADSFIKKGEQIGTIGNCNGYYLAHLHLEIRSDVNLDIGPGYSTDTKGYLDPTKFINKNRH